MGAQGCRTAGASFDRLRMSKIEDGILKDAIEKSASS